MKNYVKDYPRPQLLRKEWECLNGTWNFSFDDKNKGEEEGWFARFPKQMEIQVPFTYETKRSGIGDETRHDNVWYERKVVMEEGALAGKRTLLHFEGSDFRTKVWINGQMAGSHTGGYARFTFDITSLLKAGENTIVVKAEDSFDMEQPRGKQRWKDENFGCWYVQTTGIWKTVWMETVPEVYIKGLKLTPVLVDGALEAEMEVDSLICETGLTAEFIVSFDGREITTASITVKDNRAKTKIDIRDREAFEWEIKTWSPQEPNLYDLEVRVVKGQEVKDRVYSYFGMREIRIDEGNILLNGAPLYQRLILDQGYWRDSHLTPPDEEALIEDIDKIMALGYNGLRKHQKTEDERFLYWCDVKGMLVWSEMAASYRFSDYAAEEFTKEWMEIVKQNYSHPCIITWTPFNESWGISQVETKAQEQHFTEAVYYLTKSFDRFRPVIVNDGWEHTISDIITLHDYEECGELFKNRYIACRDDIFATRTYHSSSKSAMANGYEYKGQPVIISEYGGIAFNNDDRGWGYGNKVNTEEEFIKRFDDITTAIKEVPYVCGYCYTQVSDVQQEINGLMDIDRNFKVDADKIKEINERSIGYWRA